jgi:thymidylate synthase (FAD)
MKIDTQRFEILPGISGEAALKHIEICGRTCYKSEHKITDGSAWGFVKKIIDRGHESVLEHVSISVRFQCRRAIADQLLRHRLASFSVESTRYVDSKEGITVIAPATLWVKDPVAYAIWEDACLKAEQAYKDLREKGIAPEQARDVLPMCIKTEFVATANVREWRHMLKLRTSGAAHPQLREIMVPLLCDLKVKYPVLFDDISVKE